MNHFAIYLLPIINFCAEQIRAADTITISDRFPEQYLNTDISVLVDSSVEFSVNDYDRTKFYPNHDPQLKFGYTTKKYGSLMS